MTTRARRLIGGVALVVVLLYLGRWSAAFLTERWWAATISEAAVRTVTRWQLLGVGLDVVAVLVASAWFALQGLVVARAVATVHVSRSIGNLEVREAVPTRVLLIAALGTGGLLGLMTGAGARAWRGPVALAWSGVTYGVTDPLLGADLGLYVAQLPVWRLAHGFTVTLAILGLAVAIGLYASIGGVRRERATLIVHPHARRHLGALLVWLAALIAIGYLLQPFVIASGSAMAGVSTLGAVTRVRAAQVMSGAALGTAVLTVWWTLRGKHSVLLGGWVVLALGALLERVVVPAMASEAVTGKAPDAIDRRFDALAWGIREGTAQAPRDTVPNPTALWDEALLARDAESRHETFLGAAQSLLSPTAGAQPGWLIAVRGPGSAVRVVAVAEGVAGLTGEPVRVPPPGRADSAAAWLLVQAPRTEPGAEPWMRVAGGVPARNPLSRAMLAWARQAPGMIRGDAIDAIDWHLDPRERAAALLPMADWMGATPRLVQGRLAWVVQGLLAVQDFPRAARTRWLGDEMAGVVPAFVATVSAETGATRIYYDPAADSLAHAWGRTAPGLVEPATALPADVRMELGYPAAWLDAQLDVLAGHAWGLGARPERRLAGGVSPVWLDPVRVGRQGALEDPARRVVSAIVTGTRLGGWPVLQIDRTEVGAANIADLERLWQREPVLVHARDSARAAGDTFQTGGVRWRAAVEGTVSWQPLYAVSGASRPRLLGLATTFDDRAAGGRAPTDAWRALVGGIRAAEAAGPSEAAVIRTAREWLLRADSALARRDMTAFGRAFEGLRSALTKPGH